VRLILKHLVRRFRELGGELRLRSGVSRIRVQNGRAVGVAPDDGTELLARNILSFLRRQPWKRCRLCEDHQSVVRAGSSGPDVVHRNDVDIGRPTPRIRATTGRLRS
jgi:phytoene dehydrogenase-like protein